MSDIVAFLRARLDEDERNAKQQPTEWAEDWAKFLVDPIIGPFGGQSRLRNVATGFYVAAQSNPRRVLADVAAKRALIEPLLNDAQAIENEYGMADRLTGEDVLGIRLLASVYSDHPDYREEWQS